MLLIFRRLIFLIIFTIIGILYTIGFTKYPILNITNIFFTVEVYTNKLQITPIIDLIPAVNNIITTVINEYQTYAQYLYISGIITVSLIGFGVLLSLSFLNGFSSLFFLLAQVFMIIFSGIIMFLYYSKFIDNLIPFPDLPYGIKIPIQYKELGKYYGIGGILIIGTSIAMILNYIFYILLG